MKYCNKCKIDVAGHLTYCPLCQNELIKSENTTEEDLFPDTYETYTSHHTVLKVLGFISITVAMIAVLINCLFPTKVWWSLLVVVTVGCAWLSLAVAISKHRNILKYMLYQSIIICLFAMFLDFLTGYTGWSLSLVLPIVFTLAMIIMYLLSKILHLQTGDYIIYLLLDALFGILPLILLVTLKFEIRIPSLICILVSAISVTALIIFEGKSIYQELNRRLHV